MGLKEICKPRTAQGALKVVPGWLDSVPPHEGDDERVVLSFNFMAL